MKYENISRNEMYGKLMFHSIIVFFIAYEEMQT